MMIGLADARDAIQSALCAFKPPPRLRLSQWADQHYYISAENSAEPGKWKCIPYQIGILDAFSDPTIEQVWVMKSARVGYTLCIGALIAYHMVHDPCPILVVQPTVDDAKGYSKENIAPMINDVPSLAEVMDNQFEVEEDGPKGSANTILHKKFPGGVLSLGGANSGTAFRRVSRRVVNFDEVDAYPPSAGSDGDQIKLGLKRSEYYWNRKGIGGSTPLVKGVSRIESLYLSGDQRKYFVPCPHCGHKDYFVFSKRDSGGHWLEFSKEHPEDAHFVCSSCEEAIEHKHKRWMIERGEWRSTAPKRFTASGREIVSFHIWAAYSYSPNSTWADLVFEFLAVKDKPEEYRTFINTVLGETWEDQGEAPDWDRLYRRAGTHEVGTVPDGVKKITAGVDVQKDGCYYSVWGWGAKKQSWSIAAGFIEFDTANEKEWVALDELLTRVFKRDNGEEYAIAKMAIDSGYNATQVYTYAQRWRGRVIATKGQSKQRVIIQSPKKTDLRKNGKQLRRGGRVWNVGVDILKQELYGWLRIEKTDAPGYCWFAQHGEEFFKQLTAEQLIPVKDKYHRIRREWQVIAGRENHYLDTRVYARAAAYLIGVDRLKDEETPAPKPPDAPSEPIAETREPPPPPRQPASDKPRRFQISRQGGKGWLRRDR